MKLLNIIQIYWKVVIINDKINMQLHALDKETIDKYDSVAESLGFRSRSEMMRYMINYFIDKYDFLLSNNAIIYIIVEYEVGSYAGQDLINMQQRFNEMKIFNNEKIDDHYHMFIMIKSNPTNINSIIKMFLQIRDIYSFKILVS